MTTCLTSQSKILICMCEFSRAGECDSHCLILQIQKGYFRHVTPGSTYLNEVKKQDFSGQCSHWSMNEGLTSNCQKTEKLSHLKYLMFLFSLFETYHKTSHLHPTSCKVRSECWFHCPGFKGAGLAGIDAVDFHAGPYRPPDSQGEPVLWIGWCWSYVILLEEILHMLALLVLDQNLASVRNMSTWDREQH